MPGPPRTPTQTRRAKGNPGKRGYNKREPKLPPGTPPAPADLDDEAKAEWKRLCAEALRAQVLTTVDRGILELAARAYSMWVQAERTVKACGMTYETVSTTGALVIKAHPAVAISADAWRRYRAAVCELGFTPAARAKVTTSDPGEEESPAASYFN